MGAACLPRRKSRPTWRERQNSNNRKRFPHFKKELYARWDHLACDPSTRRYNLDYAKEWAREQAEVAAQHTAMMKRFKPVKKITRTG